MGADRHRELTEPVRVAAHRCREARTITRDNIDHLAAHFLPGGKRVVFQGRESGHAARVYLLDLDTGATKAITPEGVLGRAVSPDGKYVVVRWKGSLVKWPVEGGDPIPIPGLKPDDIAIAWTGDGKQLYVARSDEARPRRVYLFDLATQKRTLWKSLGPQDWTGALAAGIPVISDDGKHYAYLVVRSLADLYVVSGLK